MKKLKKLAALLLAGAMVLLLFTACGGGGIPGEDTQAEATYLQAVNTSRSGMQAMTNDPTLKAKANQRLEAVVKAGNYGGKADVAFEKNENGWITGITTVVQCDYKDTKLQEFFQKLNFGNANVNVNAAGFWSKVGVVVRVIDGQTYVAVSVEYTNPFKA